MNASDYAVSGDFPVIALVCSAGGRTALTTVLAALPADLPAAVIVLQHVDPHWPSLLTTILQQHTAMAVRRTRDGDAILPGQVFVAPEGEHMIMCPDGRARLVSADRAPRPSADLLLCTLASAVGPRAISVILTGAGHDGATGSVAVDRLGGTTLVQDPSTAYSRGMPDAAVSRHQPTAILPLGTIGPTLRDLVYSTTSRNGRPVRATTV
jgi:two-component system chemotaxis response regulator CheB